MAEKPKILVADDDAAICSLVSGSLASADDAVATARDGEEARALLTVASFDAVVTDLQMPHDGSRLVPWLVLHRPEVAVVVMTGLGTSSIAEDLSHEYVLLHKPFALARLRRSLAEARARRDRRLGLQQDLDAREDHCAVLSPRGTVWLVNDAWRRFARDNGYRNGTSQPGVGVHYLTLCEEVREEAHRADARSAADRIRAASEGWTAAPFRYPCHGPSEERWFQMSARPLRWNGYALVDVGHARVAAP